MTKDKKNSTSTIYFYYDDDDDGDVSLNLQISPSMSDQMYSKLLTAMFLFSSSVSFFNSFIEIQCTYQAIHLFKVYSSIIFSVYTYLQPSPQL